jgi:AcrR family transcriptional regulator
MTRYKATKKQPTQKRAQERIRQILSFSLQLFIEKGIEQTTTNDIAAAANIPIGSLYSYYNDKHEIINALSDLLIEDAEAMVDQIIANPFFEKMSWQDIITLLLWLTQDYSRQNRPDILLYYHRYSTTDHTTSEQYIHALIKIFGKLINARLLHENSQNFTEHQVMVFAKLFESTFELLIRQYNHPNITNMKDDFLLIAANYLESCVQLK